MNWIDCNELIKEYLTYCPATGELRWKKTKSHQAKKGSIAGTNGKKYRQIKIGGKQFKAHRVCWFLHHGEWPAENIDHKDGDGFNNRMANLRLAPPSVNNKNQKMYKTNSSGVTGVQWRKDRGNWRATIHDKNKTIVLGQFDSFDAAVAARKQAEIDYGYSERHGK